MSEKKEKFYTQPWFIFTVAAAAILIIVAVIIVSQMISRELTLAEVLGFKEARLDYLEDNLDKYIDIEKEDYSGFDVEISLPKPSDKEVDNLIMELLAKNRGKIKFDGDYRYDQPIAPGDKAYIWYNGYIIDENGNRQETGLTNFGDSNPTEATVGSGENIALGFDLGLLGKIPWDYSEFKKASVGTVKEGDVVYATATYIYENGLIHEDAKIRIDLRDPDYEKIWGTDILLFLKEKNIGLTNTSVFTLPLLDSPNKDKITYTSLQVDYVTRCEDNYVTVETVFPYDDENEALRNKTVYFDIFIEKTTCYETAEFNDDFIRDTLKLDEDKLAKYDGETLTEKCRSYYLDTLLEEYEDTKEQLAVNALWEKLMKNVEIKKYPQKETKRVYEDYVYQYTLEYVAANEGGAGYESVDEYIALALGMEEGTNWDPVLDAKVLEETKEKLIFYYVLREEDLIPDDEEYEKLYRAEIEADFKYSTGKDKDDYATEEEYEKAISDYEKKIIDYYGKDGYREIVYYYHATSSMLEMVNVVNVYEAEK